MLDSGMCAVYSIQNVAPKGDMPKEGLVEKTSPLCYGERTIGITRFYTALQAHVQVDALIRIWQNRSVTTNDVCVIGDNQYNIKQAQHTVDEDGLPVTDLTLSKVVSNYEFKAVP